MKKLSKMFESKTYVGECIMEFALNAFYLNVRILSVLWDISTWFQDTLYFGIYLLAVLLSKGSYEIRGDIYITLHIKLIGLREMSLIKTKRQLILPSEKSSERVSSVLCGPSENRESWIRPCGLTSDCSVSTWHWTYLSMLLTFCFFFQSDA